MFSGRLRGSTGIVSVMTMRSISDLPSRSSASSEKSACVTKTFTSVAPCSFRARAPAMSVPPVVATSSPTIATLSRTFPVTSVIST
jgi:hypothetical protein